MLVEHFRRIICVFTDPMRVDNILLSKDEQKKVSNARGPPDGSLRDTMTLTSSHNSSTVGLRVLRLRRFG